MRQRAEGAMGGGVRIAAHDRHAGQRRALLGSDHMHDALAWIIHAELGDREFGAVLSRVSTCSRDTGSAIPGSRSVVGTLWSAVARFASARHTGRSASRSPSNACGDVTS